METIELRSDLREMLERDAERESRSVNEVVNRAVELYLREQQRKKLAREIEAYEAMHSQLKADYLGQYVAIHEQKLVDHDRELAPLYRRIRARYGKISVLMRQVKEQPVEEIWMRTFSTGKIER